MFLPYAEPQTFIEKNLYRKGFRIIDLRKIWEKQEEILKLCVEVDSEKYYRQHQSKKKLRSVATQQRKR